MAVIFNWASVVKVAKLGSSRKVLRIKDNEKCKEMWKSCWTFTQINEMTGKFMLWELWEKVIIVAKGQT